MTRLHRQRLLGAAVALALLASVTLMSASGLAVQQGELLVNGNFEGGFVFVPGCGMVGVGWGCFTNGGAATYGFYDDQWKSVVVDGSHSQLVEISTMGRAASDPDRVAGIYQTVNLVKGQVYQLKVSGWIREGMISEHKVTPSDDPFRYRVQWGYTTDGSTDWTRVSNWVELPWDRIDERTSPSSTPLSFSTSFTAPGDKVTIFIRAWKKWGTAYRELDVNLDAISLFGSTVKPPVVPAGPVVVLPGPVTPAPPVVVPPVVVAPGATCTGPNLVVNGNFEGGFVNGVGLGWTAFHNGGQACYGFYDEMWSKVIKDGAHGQLIEINTICRAASDPDRFAGIYQVVKGLTPGATYELSLWGMMREEKAHPDEDKYRYRVQWGYAAADADPTQADITKWIELPWDTIYTRTAPGDMSSYTVKFQAPSDKIVLAFRAWKKWGTAQRELDVNLDAISLVGCAAPPPPDPCIWHTVVPGDTVYGLAVKYNSSVALIVERNKLANPNLIYVGQKLCIIDP